MNNELEKKLVDDFPELFIHIDNPRASLMGFGCGCDDGWFGLVYNLTKDIYDEAKKTGVLCNDDFYVVQIKEKFGQLRYYITYGNDEIFKLIEEAERVSATICEWCGEEGKIRNNSWIRTLCDDCQNKHETKWAKKLRDLLDNRKE